ncbi:hypothetical protein Q1695_006396 [Nippostrongylus brasiliensis]|nr:hypothetical protein Q1695_006396 [Nippostrongylus brasiliensis]
MDASVDQQAFQLPFPLRRGLIVASWSPRSSSVTLPSPGTAGGEMFGSLSRENYLLPGPRRASRASIASAAWGSFRMSVQNLSKAAMQVFLVAPCSRHRCCVGCVSLHDAVALICVAELVVLGLSSLVAVDFYVSDGRMFYTKELEGKGATIVFAFSAFLLVSIPVIAFTLAAWRFRKPHLYIVHILWQWTVLQALLIFAYSILRRTFSEELRNRTAFLLPSAIVLSVVGLIAVTVQSWWLFVFVDAMFFEISESRSRRPKHSSASKDDEFSVCTVDSRHRNFAIPTVKVDCSQSVDSSSAIAARKITLAKMDEVSEFSDVVDV